jgi:hypothetical protein
MRVGEMGSVGRGSAVGAQDDRAVLACAGDGLYSTWNRLPWTVREAYETLRQERRIAYTTVLSALNNLATKEGCQRHG